MQKSYQGARVRRSGGGGVGVLVGGGEGVVVWRRLLRIGDSLPEKV